jgi:hypothetical protein
MRAKVASPSSKEAKSWRFCCFLRSKGLVAHHGPSPSCSPKASLSRGNFEDSYLVR